MKPQREREKERERGGRDGSRNRVKFTINSKKEYRKDRIRSIQ